MGTLFRLSFATSLISSGMDRFGHKPNMNTTSLGRSFSADLLVALLKPKFAIFLLLF